MKYKHIPTNSIYTLDKNGEYFVSGSNKIPAQIVVGALTKDWEKVKLWTILSFQTAGGYIRTLAIDIRSIPKEYCTNYDVWIDHRLNSIPKSTIYSIRRESDCEIFTIGDKLPSNGKYYSIFKIEINEHYCYLHYLTEKSEHYTWDLMDVDKVKQPLFTTEDGVDIYEGDHYYCIRKNGCIYQYYTANKNSCKNEKHIDFSSEVAAEEYILMNKPCLSINDIRNFPTVSIGPGGMPCLSLNMFKKLVKSKL